MTNLHGPRRRGPRKFLEVVGFWPAAGTEFTAVAVTMAAAEAAMSAVPTPTRIPSCGVVATATTSFPNLGRFDAARAVSK